MGRNFCVSPCGFLFLPIFLVFFTVEVKRNKCKVISNLCLLHQFCVLYNFWSLGISFLLSSCSFCIVFFLLCFRKNFGNILLLFLNCIVRICFLSSIIPPPRFFCYIVFSCWFIIFALIDLIFGVLIVIPFFMKFFQSMFFFTSRVCVFFCLKKTQ